MKNFFPGYYLPTNDEMNKQWENGIFIFDANVLLNIYAYPEEAREEFISALESFKDMTWIPYQVMLEFHRNRYKRITTSNKSVIDLRDSIKKSLQNVEQGFKAIQFEKRNTGILDVDERISNLKIAGNSVLEAIEQACKKLSGANLDDTVAHRLANIYSSRIGDAPKDQEDLESLVEGGEHRYEQKIPPGFADAKDKNAIFYHRGLKYEARYGDLIVWRQMINHIREVKGTHVVFVTAEIKVDFWLKDDKDNIIGPLPALIEEFLMETGATSFWLYSPEQFLEQAKIRDNKLVSTNTINEVREVTQAREIDLEGDGLSPFFYKWMEVGQQEKVKKYLMFKYFSARYPNSSVRRIDDAFLLAHGDYEACFRTLILIDDDFQDVFKFCSNLAEPMLYENFVVLIFSPYRKWKEYSVLRIASIDAILREVMKKNAISQITVIPYDGRTVMDFHDVYDDI